MLIRSVPVIQLMSNIHRIIFIFAAFYAIPAMAVENDPLNAVKAALASANAAGEVARVEDFLSALPVDWRSNYTFVYRSSSLQAASRSFPRAIAFSEDGQAVLTFNGHPEQYGYNRVELAIVRPNNLRLEYRDVTFCPEGSSLGCQAALSKANPEQCTTCHGQGPHYIWSPYKTWSGVYGSGNDVLTQGEDAELTDFKGFLDGVGGNSRYRQLLFPANHDDAFPYRLNIEPGIFLDQRVNSHFTMALLKQHGRILADKILSATASMPAERTALIRRLAACRGFDNTATNSEIRALAAAIGLPFDEYWRFGLDAASSSDEGVLNFSDGIMRLPGALLAFLLPRLPEYADLVRGNGIGYEDIIKYGSNLEVPSLRTTEVLRNLDRSGLMYPSLGTFNALNYLVPSERFPANRNSLRTAVCTVGN